MNRMDTAMLRQELQSLVDDRRPQFEVERIARRAIQFMDHQEARAVAAEANRVALLAEIDRIAPTQRRSDR